MWPDGPGKRVSIKLQRRIAGRGGAELRVCTYFLSQVRVLRSFLLEAGPFRPVFLKFPQITLEWVGSLNYGGDAHIRSCGLVRSHPPVSQDACPRARSVGNS